VPAIGFAAVLQGDLIGGLTRHFGEERLLSAGLVLIGAGLLLTGFELAVSLRTESPWTEAATGHRRSNLTFE
jgi:cyanate permease